MRFGTHHRTTPLPHLVTGGPSKIRHLARVLETRFCFSRGWPEAKSAESLSSDFFSSCSYRTRAGAFALFYTALLALLSVLVCCPNSPAAERISLTVRCHHSGKRTSHWVNKCGGMPSPLHCRDAGLNLDHTFPLVLFRPRRLIAVDHKCFEARHAFMNGLAGSHAGLRNQLGQSYIKRHGQRLPLFVVFWLPLGKRCDGFKNSSPDFLPSTKSSSPAL
jgi:hypothetical protein